MPLQQALKSLPIDVAVGRHWRHERYNTTFWVKLSALVCRVYQNACPIG
jgi:hypothetical protein